MGKKLNVVLQAPITTDKEIQIKNRIQAVTFRNAGTATVNFDNGSYTLDPGETLHIAAVDNNDEVVINGRFVAFDTSTGSVKKLQVLLLVADDPNIC